MKNLFAFLKLHEKYHPSWIDGMRIAFGLLIHLKALLFIGATAAFLRTLEIHGSGINDKWLVYSIGTVNLLGGTFILLGLKTRVVSIIQIPFILLSMNYSYHHLTGNFFYWEMILSVIILFFLIFYIMKGSGRFSVDAYIRNNYKSLQPSKKNEVE